MKITHKIDIHLDKYRPEAEIVVMQCDANTRELQFALYSNDAAWPIPEAAKIYVGYSKPDGTGGFYDTLPDGTGACAVESNTVTAVLAEQVLTVPGKVFASVSLQQEGQILATFAVQLNVKPKPGIAAMQSENYFCIKALIDAATVAAQKPVQVITVSEGTDGGYVSSHNLSGIQSVVNLQLPVACHWREENVTLYLAEYQTGGPFTFTAVSDSIEYRVVINSDEDISCTMTKLAGSDAIPTKVSQLENDSGFLTELPVTTTKVSLTEQPDGSYLSSLTAAEIMADYKANKTVHCYHDKMILPLIHSVITSAVFSGIYDGQIQTVTVDSNKVATVTATPVSSGGGGADGIIPHIGENGNWWIGDVDTGVSASATDEQINDALEEYMANNPLVKTVNGTAPDENGNVELDIPSGGTGERTIFDIMLEESVQRFSYTLTEEDVQKILNSSTLIFHSYAIIDEADTDHAHGKISFGLYPSEDPAAANYNEFLLQQNVDAIAPAEWGQGPYAMNFVAWGLAWCGTGDKHNAVKALYPTCYIKGESPVHGTTGIDYSKLAGGYCFVVTAATKKLGVGTRLILSV